MNKILALYDSDIFYATRFMEYFVRKNATGFEISVFTRKDSLEEFLEMNCVEIFLTGAEIILEEQALKKIRHTYYLSDTSSINADNTCMQVNKYQAVSSLLEEIISDYKRRENLTREDYHLEKMNLISVFSPIGGKEKVSFAWSLSALLSETKRALFIILDLLPVPIISSIEPQSQCLTDLIYYLKENPDVDKMHSLVRSCGKLSVLSGILHGADILSLTKEDIQSWGENLIANSDYETIIFYLGCYTEATIELMKLSDEVIITSLDNSYEMAVTEEWERQMNHSGVHINQDKFRLVKLHPEEEPVNLPISMQELMNSISWSEAEQYLNY